MAKNNSINLFIKRAVESGVAISVDLGFEEAVCWSDEDYKYLQGIDFFMPNNKETQLITKLDSIEDSLYKLKQWVKHPIITLGKEGAAFLDEESRFHVIPAQKTNAVNTSGAGGAAMALRTIPVALEYAEKLHCISPHAWLINFTNPSGIISQALMNYSSHKRIVGICDAPVWQWKQEISEKINKLIFSLPLLVFNKTSI